MQWLTADIVFDGYDFHTDYYLLVNEQGQILEVNANKPNTEVNRYEGLLMPGMLNAHCHLELSHTKGLIEEKTGLATFLQDVSKQIPQKVEEHVIQKAMQAADAEMLQNGIVAVGDICNTHKSLSVKKTSSIHYHNFVECIAIKAEDSKRRFEDYHKVFEVFLENNLLASLSLHTPYTCNKGVYKLVNEHSKFISIHNQESEAENLLFERKEGTFDKFYEHFGLNKSEIIKEQTCTSSFENSQRLLDAESKKLFVHNTFTRKSDLQFADDNTWFCFCPKANLYIEDTMPDVPMFSDFQDKIVLGTDSLASNDSLNILSEIKTIQDNFPDIPLNQILQWATINGAKLFGIEKQFGSFEVAKTPGIINVTGFDVESKKILKANSEHFTLAD